MENSHSPPFYFYLKKELNNIPISPFFDNYDIRPVENFFTLIFF